MINLTEFKLKLALWKSQGTTGEIVRQGDKLLMYLTMNRKHVKAAQDGLKEAKRIYDLQTKMETERIAELEAVHKNLQEAYALVKELLIPPKPTPPVPEKKPEPPKPVVAKPEDKKKVKKTKIIEVEEEE